MATSVFDLKGSSPTTITTKINMFITYVFIVSFPFATAEHSNHVEDEVVGGVSDDPVSLSPNNQQLVVTMVMVSILLKTVRKFAGLEFSPSFFEMGAVVLSVALVVLRQGWTTAISPLGVTAAFYFNSCPTTSSTTRSQMFGYRLVGLFTTAWSYPDKFSLALVSFCVMLTR